MRGWVPDFVLRWKIRTGLKQLLQMIDTEGSDYETRVKIESEFVKELRSVQSSERIFKLIKTNFLRNSPIAIHQQEANDQHYEVPAEFFKLSLGPKLKYSSCYFETENSTLAEAEVAMLELYIRRSGAEH